MNISKKIFFILFSISMATTTSLWGGDIETPIEIECKNDIVVEISPKIAMTSIYWKNLINIIAECSIKGSIWPRRPLRQVSSLWPMMKKLFKSP